MSSFNKDFAASVLIESIYTTDAKACLKYGIAERTLRNYRKRLAEDADFAAYFHTKKLLLDEMWADDLLAPIKAAARLITESAEQADTITKKNPEFIHAIAGALKICADVRMTSKLIDARNAPADRPQASIPGQGDTEAPSASRYTN